MVCAYETWGSTSYVLFFFFVSGEARSQVQCSGCFAAQPPSFGNKGHQTGNTNEPSKRGFLGGVLFNKLDVPSVFKNGLMLVVIQSVVGGLVRI